MVRPIIKRPIRAIWPVVLVLFALTLPATPGWGGDILARVRSRQLLFCGVSEGLPGFSQKDPQGRWQGIDADFCRAVAAAALGDPEKVRFVPLTAFQRVTALQSGQIDLLSRNTTWTLGREAGLGVLFAGILYYDGQGFMVRKGGGINRLADLKGSTICVERRTTNQANLDDYFQVKGWKYQPLVFESLDQTREAFLTGRCRAYTSDRSQLASVRSTVPGGEKNYVILKDQISKEPLGPAVLRGDMEWFTLIRWVLFSLIEAEERGITRANLTTQTTGKTDPGLARFLGRAGNFGRMMGVSPDWTVRVIKAVGNYGELFEHNLGRRSPLGLDRGLNRLWSQGGLLYAPPFR